MENFQFLAKKKWYSQWWGITIIIIFSVILSLILAISLLTWRYTKLIKQGYAEELKQAIFGQQQIDPQILAIRKDLELDDRPFLGNKDATLVIVAFIDFKCPICKEQNAVLQKVIGKYGNRIKLIWRNFPVETLYPGSTKLAQMSYCAHEQGAYWLAHEYLFTHQNELTQNLTAEDINKFIDEFSLDRKKFNACLVGDKTKTEINRDYVTGYKYGVSGTPTFFINSYKVQGNIPFEIWDNIINKILNP